MISSSADALRYYSSEDVHEVRSLSGAQNIEEDIFVVPYTTEIYGYDYQTALYEKKFRLTEKKSFRGLVVERWRVR